MKLNGNTILITGGSAGIGLALAKKFVSLQNKVIITGRKIEALNKAKEECPELEIFQSDVSDSGAIENTARELAEKYPSLNVLINNAGIMISRNVASGSNDLNGLTSEVEVNINGTVRTTAAYVDLIKKNNGTIINVSSGLAFVPMQSAPIYCATKAFVHSYTTSLRYQLKDSGVDVIELAPPGVKTKLTEDISSEIDIKLLTTDELVDATISGIKAGKTLITPGQSAQLRFMSRLAPGFIEGQLAKNTESLVPPPE